MARLRRSRLSRPGLGRVRSGRGFRYTDAAGETIHDPDARERIEAIAIPPAWKDVWIAPDERAHIQATGTDAAGRRQYIYHADWRARRDRTKFERMLDLAGTLTAARASVTRDLRTAGNTRERALAAAFRILDRASPRVGGERYRDTNGSYGLSTLLVAHATVKGDAVDLAFVGKGGLDWEATIVDADLAKAVRALSRREPNARLLAWHEHGDWHPLSAAEINDYVREKTHGDFSAKDFRTLTGTVIAAESLAASGPTTVRKDRQHAITVAMQAASDALGNTPTIARTSYVDPRVVDRYRRGKVLDLSVGSAERALRELLGRQ